MKTTQQKLPWNVFGFYSKIVQMSILILLMSSCCRGEEVAISLPEVKLVGNSDNHSRNFLTQGRIDSNFDSENGEGPLNQQKDKIQNKIEIEAPASKH